jgi:cysteine desulfurase
MLKIPVYLDYNATTPCDPRVVEAMLPYFSGIFGNAASQQHSYGWQAAEAVAIARDQVANLIGADRTEIFFTSGATESVNLALKGAYEMYGAKGNHIVTCATEHKAVLDTCRHLEKLGAEITYLAVNENGHIDLAALEKAIRPTTIMIAVMYANNEIGTIQLIKEISEIARKGNVFLFTDATQAVGKIPVNVHEDGIDLMAFSSHKLYGPKGVGALYVRRKNPRVKLIAQIDGGGHERGIRSGTLNVPGIVGFGKACELVMHEMADEMKRQCRLRDQLENALVILDDCKVNGDPQLRLPNTSNISFPYTDGAVLMTELTKYVAVSSGSACTSGSIEPSYVLKELGLEDNIARGAIRFSLGRFTTEEEIAFTIEKVTASVESLKERKIVG